MLLIAMGTFEEVVVPVSHVIQCTEFLSMHFVFSPP